MLLKIKSTIQHHSEIDIALADVVKMIIPNYKPESYSVSTIRLERNEFDVTVKVYPNRQASGYLNSLEVGVGGDGDGMIWSYGKSSGKHCNNNNSRSSSSTLLGERVCIIAYDEGITEGLPMGKAELKQMAEQQETNSCNNNNNNSDGQQQLPIKEVTLLWASRTMGDTFWHDQIEALQNKHRRDQFEVVHLLSRENYEAPKDSYKGRIHPGVITEVFALEQAKARREHPLFLSVGTKEMMCTTTEMLYSMEYPMP